MHTSFFLNDPYFPRPRPGEELYKALKGGYCKAMGGDEKEKDVATAFFASIEARQTTLDEEGREGKG